MSCNRDIKSKIVAFDVGGRVFKISKDAIEQHPDSMLARLVSDTWHADSDLPVFIDRDGDIFAQVLNYLRYGSITLPMTVPKSMFLRDMEFYGIVPEDGTIQLDSDDLKNDLESAITRLSNDTQSSLEDMQKKLREIQVGRSHIGEPGCYNLKNLALEIKRVKNR